MRVLDFVTSSTCASCPVWSLILIEASTAAAGSGALVTNTMGSKSPMASSFASSQAAIEAYAQCRGEAVACLNAVWNDVELAADDRAVAFTETDRRAQRVWEVAVAQVHCTALRPAFPLPLPPPRHSLLMLADTPQAEAGRHELFERAQEARRAVSRIREQLGEAANGAQIPQVSPCHTPQRTIHPQLLLAAVELNSRLGLQHV